MHMEFTLPLTPDRSHVGVWMVCTVGELCTMTGNDVQDQLDSVLSDLYDFGKSCTVTCLHPTM